MTDGTMTTTKTLKTTRSSSRYHGGSADGHGDREGGGDTLVSWQGERLTKPASWRSQWAAAGGDRHHRGAAEHHSGQDGGGPAHRGCVGRELHRDVGEALKGGRMHRSANEADKKLPGGEEKNKLGKTCGCWRRL